MVVLPMISTNKSFQADDFCEMNEEAHTVHIHKNLRLLILRYISVILYHHHQ